MINIWGQREYVAYVRTNLCCPLALRRVSMTGLLM
jgi:hypothetical protein